MDNMLEHPGTELQLLIKEKGLTQKAFASILGKKVSEVNELLKGKRNITIQRDYLLHQTIGTPIKYWILKQVDYDYSLLDIEEESQNRDIIPDDNKESTDISKSFGTQGKIHENVKQVDSSSDNSASKRQTEPQKTPTKKLNPKDDEDYQKRARIFKTF